MIKPISTWWFPSGDLINTIQSNYHRIRHQKKSENENIIIVFLRIKSVYNNIMSMTMNIIVSFFHNGNISIYVWWYNDDVYKYIIYLLHILWWCFYPNQTVDMKHYKKPSRQWLLSIIVLWSSLLHSTNKQRRNI